MIATTISSSIRVKPVVFRRLSRKYMVLTLPSPRLMRSNHEPAKPLFERTMKPRSDGESLMPFSKHSRRYCQRYLGGTPFALFVDHISPEDFVPFVAL